METASITYCAWLKLGPITNCMREAEKPETQ